MRADSELLILIGRIYDAVLDSELWPTVLANSAHFVGGSASALFLKDSVHKTQNNIFTWNYSSEYTQKYLDQYINLDPFTSAQFFFDVEEVISLGDIMPHSDFHRTRFYLEWVRPQHWCDAIAATLDKSATSYAAFSVIRHEQDGIVDEFARERMKLVVPHVRRAVLISKLLDMHKIEASRLVDTLDGLVSAVFLVDARGRIVHANTAGHLLIAQGTVLRGMGGKLQAADPTANRTLGNAIANSDAGDQVAGATDVTFSLPAKNGQPYLAHVLPLTSGARQLAGAAYSAVAAVFVRAAVLTLPLPPEIIAKTFKLTPSELRVLLAIVEVGGAPEVAEALGVSLATVKTHLQHLFAKTGVNRQADLVKIVAGFANPIME